MPEEERTGVRLTNLDQPLFADADASKRDLVDYLDAVADRLVPVLAERALSVIRVLRGQAPFMQKNLPGYAPASISTLDVPTQDGKRVVRYPVCDDRETLLWFANQRAVEYHPTLFRGHAFDTPTYLIVDLDPPEGSDAFPRAVEAALLVREVLADVGMDAMAKTSGAKGVHVVVPLVPGHTAADVAAATRAVAVRAERLDPQLTTTAFVVEERGGKVFLDATRAGGATLVAAYSPRVRAGVPVSFPLGLGRPDRCVTGLVHDRHRPRASRRRRPVDHLDATAAAPRPRTGRGGTHHPGSPRRGDARRQASRSRTPGGRTGGMTSDPAARAISVQRPSLRPLV